MPDSQLMTTYERARDRHRQAGAELVPLVEEIAMESIRDVLPGAVRLEVHGEVNEDWAPTLRIRRVVGSDGAVLFDSAVGHADEQVEAMVDEVGVEYLDLLLDLTGD
jgi:hypothetical protein